jgi:hypothetical protein
MSSKSIILTISLISIMMIIMYFWGTPMGLLFATVLILCETIIFTVKKDSYFKFLEFFNPKAFKIYSDRGKEFLEKTRKQNLIFMYILGGVTLLNTILQFIFQRYRDNRYFEMGSGFILIMIVMTAVILISSYFINRYFLKKVREGLSHKELLSRQIIFGIIFGVLFVGIIFALFTLYYVFF